MHKLRTKQVNAPNGQLPNSIQYGWQQNSKRSVESTQVKGNADRDASNAYDQYTNQNTSDADPSQLSVSLKAKLLKLGICNHALNAAGN